MKASIKSILFSLLLSQLTTLTNSFSPGLSKSPRWQKLIRVHSTIESPLKATKLASADDIIQFAAETGVDLSLKTLGPGYRAVARAKHNETQIIGYCNGFIRPTGQLLHMDKMEVFKPALQKARAENPDFTSGGTVFGVGLLLGCLCLTYGE